MGDGRRKQCRHAMKKRKRNRSLTDSRRLGGFSESRFSDVEVPAKLFSAGLGPEIFPASYWSGAKLVSPKLLFPALSP